MTVNELIEILKTQHPGDDVVVAIPDGDYLHIDSVTLPDGDGYVVPTIEIANLSFDVRFDNWHVNDKENQ
jgi:hypothetical protein